MKKIISILTAFALFCGNALAEGLVVKDVTVPQGGEAYIEVALENPTTEIAAFQFNVELVSGIEQVTNEKGKLVYEKGERLDEDFTLSMSTEENSNLYKVLGYYTDTQPIPGTSGALVKIPVTADASLRVGSTFICKLSGINLTEPDETKHSPEDITFNITIGEDVIVFDEASSALPSYTAGEKGNVRMTRSIKAGVWSTIVLPFTLTKTKAEEAFGSDVQLAEFSGFETEYADDEDVTPDAITLNFTTYTMTARKGMTGGKPFLIKTSKNITTIEAKDVTLFREVTDTEKSDQYETTGVMTGRLVKTIIPEDGLFISNNKFYYSAGLTNIKAFRAWFQLGSVLDKETDFSAKVRIEIDDEPTAIEDLNSVSVSNGAVYNVNGQLVGTNVKIESLPKGVYIVNGKKVNVR